MKLLDIKEFINQWPKSLAVLKQRVLDYFERNKIATDNVWFPDIDIVFPQSLNNQENIQVVFFGGFPERVFETGNWPDKKFTFWCLSSKVQKILINLFNFVPASVNVISRYELFEKSSDEKKLDLNSDIQIIYSGRLSSQKNIEMLLAFSSILQEKTDKNIELLLLGEWDNHIPKHRGRYVIESYQKHIADFCEEINLQITPKFINHLGHHEWPELLGDNCLMANFSTFVCEDFGVSVAQAQALGIPMILSKWGGHCDVEAGNIHWVEVNEIGESFSSKEQILLKAQIVVEKFLSNKLNIANKSADFFVSDKREFISLADLQSIRMDLMKDYGNEMMLLGQDRLSLFASSTSGKKFFNDYASIFSGKV